MNERTIRQHIVTAADSQTNLPLNLSIVEIIKSAAHQRKTGDNLYINHHFMPAWNAIGMPTTHVRAGTLSNAVGLALAARMDKSDEHTLCIVSDTDHHKGHTWEAALLASKHNLNMTVIVNRANLQADGFTEQLLPLDSLRDKYEAFNWHTIEVDGQNFWTPA